MAHIDSLSCSNRPGYIITAPLHYAMLSKQSNDLQEVNRNAAMIVADGMPLVWLSRIKGQPIEERVAGSDLVPALCELAERRSKSVFLLGGAPGIADQAAERLVKRHPNLTIAGTACPKMSELTEDEERSLVRSIRDANTGFLFFARGQPDGEIWLSKYYRELSCICIQVGASIDFLAGGVRRAPRWMQLSGVEWAYRLSQEPSRLLGRYLQNAAFLALNAPRDILS